MQIKEIMINVAMLNKITITYGKQIFDNSTTNLSLDRGTHM